MNAATKPSESLSEPPCGDDSTLSWDCAFCGKLRIWEGGWPELFAHLNNCATCGSRRAEAQRDRESIRGLIREHLL